MALDRSYQQCCIPGGGAAWSRGADPIWPEPESAPGPRTSRAGSAEKSGGSAITGYQLQLNGHKAESHYYYSTDGRLQLLYQVFFSEGCKINVFLFMHYPQDPQDEVLSQIHREANLKVILQQYHVTQDDCNEGQYTKAWDRTHVTTTFGFWPLLGKNPRPYSGPRAADFSYPLKKFLKLN